MSGSTPSTRVSLLVCLRDPSDERAWRTFVDLYTPVIVHYGRRLGLQDADLLDAVQQVLIQVLRSIRGFEYDPQRGQFRSWLGAITLRQMNRHRQKITRDRPLTGGASTALLDRREGAVDPVWVDEFNAQVLKCALKRIRTEFSAAVWEAFELVWVSDALPADAARQLGRPPEWVYQAKHKVVRRLKQEIEYLASDLPHLPGEAR